MKTWDEMGIYLPTHAGGPEVATTCPQCSHERKKKNAKCLSANVVDGVWHCNHCGWSGSLVGGDERLVPAWKRPMYRTPPALPPSALSESATAWFRERGITSAVLARNKITTAKVYMPQVEDEVGAVVFPYFRDGAVVNRKYRDRTKNFRMETGAERILYGLDDIGETLVWVEGECDKLAVEVAGMTSCVSVPDGAPALGTKDYSGKFTFLESATDRLAAVERHILAVDADAPGKLLEEELARRLGRGKCWRVEWPAGCKDANEVLQKHGAPDLRWYLDHAEPYPIEGVFTMLGLSSKIYALHETGLERGVSTGWKCLDPYYTVRPGEFTVVIGVPGSGKSNWVDALAVNLAREQGWNFAIFSPENQPLEDHMSRMIEKYVRLPFSDGPTPRMSKADIAAALPWGTEHFQFILPEDEHAWDIEWILGRAKELVYRHGIRGLVIDPWNELEPNRRQSETETDYVSRVLRTVRQFGRQHGVHVWMVVHPTKMYRDDKGKYPIPTLYDASGSAHWRNKADNGLCIWRDLSVSATTKEVDVHVQKIRFRQIGRLGKVTLEYDPPTACYSDLPESSQMPPRRAWNDDAD